VANKKIDPEEYRCKWGIPDWTDATAYPAKLSNNAWRWEFLRRRDDYRQDWLAWKDRLREYDVWNSGPKKEGWEEMGLLADKKREVFVRYDLTGVYPPDPRKQQPPLFFRKDRPDRGKPYKILVSGYYRELVRPPSENKKIAQSLPPVTIPQDHALYVFDLSKQLTPQLKAAAKQLQESQSHLAKIKVFRARRDLWHIYLRALDAKTSGATNKQIWKVLSEDARADNPYARGRDLVRAAENIRDNGFA
jgi:hypothetical protein